MSEEIKGELLSFQPNIQLQSESIIELTKALSKVQSKLTTVHSNKSADFITKKGNKFSYSYADLATVWNSCRQPLSENGFAVIQSVIPQNGGIAVVTTLSHISGEWVRSILPIPTTDDPQKIGSVITYARRYSLCGLIGITVEDEDDDAQSVSGKNREVKKDSYPHSRCTPEQIKEYHTLLKLRSESTGKDVKELGKSYIGWTVPKDFKGVWQEGQMSEKQITKVIENLKRDLEKDIEKDKEKNKIEKVN